MKLEASRDSPPSRILRSVVRIRAISFSGRMALNEHSLRGTFTLWRRAVVLMGPNCQRRMTAPTIPTFIEYDKTVRDLPALAKGALF